MSRALQKNVSGGVYHFVLRTPNYDNPAFGSQFLIPFSGGHIVIIRGSFFFEWLRQTQNEALIVFFFSK